MATEVGLAQSDLVTGSARVGQDRAARARRRLRPARIVMFLIMAVVAVVMLYPFFYMLVNSFKTQAQYQLGSGFSLASWRLLFSSQPILRELLNSLLVSCAAVLIILLISTAAGFAFAKIRYRARGLVFVLVIACMFVPLPSIVIPEYINISKLGILDTYWGAILVYAALGIPFSIYLMTTYFRSVPDDLVEAASIDGVSNLNMWWRLGVPLARPAIFTVAVLQFIQIWNDLLVGLLFLQNPTDHTVTVGLALLQSGRVLSVPALMAGSVLSVIPPIIVYVLFQKHLVRGITMGMGK
ncbi:MAG TPA: carbohydrate ABC transporter permease [Streptosporangiaceae bacterium]|nr:carbohydrate ABC transporter permease [Streptosporangiaceae bacterium]